MTRERNLMFWLLAAAAFLLTIALLREILLPFVAGFVIAYFLNPLADRLEAAGLNRTMATTLIVGVVGVLVALAMIFLLPLLANQLRELALSLPDQLAKLRGVVENWARARLGASFPAFEQQMQKAMDELSQSWTSGIGGVVKSVWSQGLALVNFLSLILITPVVTFYLLADWHRMLAKLETWLPRDHEATIRSLASDVNDAVAAFIRGQGAVCLILAVFYAVGLTLVGLKNGLLIGLVTGIMSFVPFVGFVTGLATALGVATVQFWPALTPILKVAGIFAIGISLDSGYLSPKIVGSKIGLHPVWLIFSLFAFSYLFGFVGLLVAVPVAAATGVVVRHFLGLYLASHVYHGGDTKPVVRLADGQQRRSE